MRTRQFLPHLLLMSAVSLCLPVLADKVPDALRPPKGQHLALVVFEDLQCPKCGQAAPLLDHAKRDYKIPLVQHDFSLPKHNWSFDAAVIARYFDKKELGDEFRLDVFQHQLEIFPNTLRAFAERFARKKKVTLPFAVEKDPKLIALVKADKDLGDSLHVNHTPTIYIVSNNTNGKPYVEVPEDTSQLYSMIDAMKQELGKEQASQSSQKAAVNKK